MRIRIGLLIAALSALVPASPPAVASPPATVTVAPGSWAATGAPVGTTTNAVAPSLFALPDGTVFSYANVFWSPDHIQFERWSPVTGAWSPLADPALPGVSRVAQFGDGRVIAVSGSATEIFDPSTGLWTPGASLDQDRSDALAAPLRDGRVAFIGGPGGGVLTTVIVSPDGTTKVTRPSRLNHYWGKPVVLADGRVLVVDGAGSELYDPVTDSWASVPEVSPGSVCGRGCPVVALSDGRVLAAINRDGNSASRYLDPATLTWSDGPMLVGALFRGSAVQLSDGRVMAASDIHRAAQVLDPADPTTGWRPVVHGNGMMQSLLALPGGGVLRVEGQRNADVFEPTALPPAWSLGVSATMSQPNIEVEDTEHVTATVVDAATEMTMPLVRVIVSVAGAHGGTVVDCFSPSTCRTDTRGQVEVTYKGLRAGADSVTLTADLDDDGVADGGEPAIVVSLLWRKVTTTLAPVSYIAVSTGPPGVTLGKMTARLSYNYERSPWDKSGNVVGRTVRFTVRSTPLCQAVTDSRGLATCTTLNHAAVVANGAYDVTFDGDDGHLSTRARGALTPLL